jgi:O-acetyl-ADP-ribose deacetylase (regulator of RNase III)
MIKHIKCDIFESGADVICHQVNCQGVMGSGIAKQVREKYPNNYQGYCIMCKSFKPSELLGKVFCGIVKDKFVIANLFAQENFGYDGKCYTDYDALRKCLQQVADSNKQKVIAIPYLMGCHRGGGDWNIVYKMIEEVFGGSDCEVLICEYNGG